MINMIYKIINIKYKAFKIKNNMIINKYQYIIYKINIDYKKICKNVINIIILFYKIYNK